MVFALDGDSTITRFLAREPTPVDLEEADFFRVFFLVVGFFLVTAFFLVVFFLVIFFSVVIFRSIPPINRPQQSGQFLLDRHLKEMWIQIHAARAPCCSPQQQCHLP